MLTPTLCRKCKSEMVSITTWDDTHEHWYCGLCGHEQTGDAVDAADVARSKAECRKLLGSE